MKRFVADLKMRLGTDYGRYMMRRRLWDGLVGVMVFLLVVVPMAHLFGDKSLAEVCFVTTLVATGWFACSILLGFIGVGLFSEEESETYQENLKRKSQKP